MLLRRLTEWDNSENSYKREEMEVSDCIIAREIIFGL
jgi:hypothetical protein